jgi:hypothetical protein
MAVQIDPLDFSCPTCRAPTGEPCKALYGRAHRTRIDKAVEAEEYRLNVAIHPPPSLWR